MNDQVMMSMEELEQVNGGARFNALSEIRRVIGPIAVPREDGTADNDVVHM